MEETYLSYARYGEADLLKALADDNIGRSESLANYVQQDTENTPLHMGTQITEIPYN
jgi:DNA topoisomerase IA